MTIAHGPYWNKRAWGIADTTDFRGWGKSFEGALDQVLTKIDTNIDWDTVEFPTTSYGIAGYSIWAWPTSSFRPFYFRMQYGALYLSSSGSYYNYLMFRPSLSTDSTFGTFSTWDYQWATGHQKAAINGLSYEAILDDECLIITEKSNGYGFGRHPHTQIIERSRDQNYNITNDGAAMITVCMTQPDTATATYWASYAQILHFSENPSDPLDTDTETRGYAWDHMRVDGPSPSYLVTPVPWRGAPRDEGNGVTSLPVQPMYLNWNGVMRPMKSIVKVPSSMIASKQSIPITNEVTNEIATYHSGNWGDTVNTRAWETDGNYERWIYRYQ